MTDREAPTDEYLAIRERLRRYDFEQCVADPERYGSAERFLQLAIEAVTDMGNHLVASLQLGFVDSYGDVPRLLAEQGHLDQDLAGKRDACAPREFRVPTSQGLAGVRPWGLPLYHL